MNNISPRNSDLVTRAIVGAVLIGVAAGALWLGGIVFWIVLSAAGLLMMAEWADLAGANAQQKLMAQFALSVPLAIMAPIAAGPGFFALGLLAGAMFFVAAATRIPRLAAGTIYVGVPILSLLILRAEPDGIRITFWAMALVWACDIGAYFAGRAIGGPKLAPAISPGKTWAGLVGGMVAAGLFGLVMYGWGLRAELAIASPFLAVLAQLGDLFESQLKREAGVKDSGNLLPGHGGFMDRLDGLVPVAPVAALLVLWSVGHS